MPLKDIQLCHMDPLDRESGWFQVTAHSNDQAASVTFDCDSESDAKKLRDAIREHAACLRFVQTFTR